MDSDSCRVGNIYDAEKIWTTLDDYVRSLATTLQYYVYWMFFFLQWNDNKNPLKTAAVIKVKAEANARLSAKLSKMRIRR